MLYRIKLGTRLILGFLAVALITLVLGLIGYYGAVKEEKLQIADFIKTG